jgi:ABC-type antimicrobial peptide transport system ATPase subunit
MEYDINDFIMYKVKDKMGCAIYGYGTIKHISEEFIWFVEGGVIYKGEVIKVFEPIKERD